MRPIVWLAAMSLLLGACSQPGGGASPGVSASVPADGRAPSTTPGAGSASGPGSAPVSGSAGSWAGRHLVSLGDSYTAGSWTGTTVRSPAAFCAQSAVNYPRQLAAALAMTLSDASCNGARTSNVAQPQAAQGEVAPAQLTAIRPDTALVTIALGVNDNGLFGALVGCSRFTPAGLGSAPCRERILRDSANPVSQIPSVTSGLVRDILAIKARAPQARIILLGYPKILPDGDQCPERWPIATGDAAWFNQSLDQLDIAIADAAGQTHSQFIDLRPVTAAHTVCADDPWFNGATADGGDGASYHPRSAYMTGVAKALTVALE